MSYDEAKKLMEDAQKVMFMRDKKTIDRIQIGTITAAGVNIEDMYSIEAYKSYEFHNNRTNEYFRPIRHYEWILQTNAKFNWKMVKSNQKDI